MNGRMTGHMSGFLDALVKRFEELEDHLNRLDAATGDGDHGSTILKGLRAAAAAPDAPEKAFRRAAGGASGSLFGALIGALHTVDTGESAIGPALADATRKIGLIGQAKAGEKTMLDALVPASDGASPDDAARLARQGCEATRDMPARRGRAKHVEGGGIGHIDAGATSVAELLAVFAACRTPA